MCIRKEVCEPYLCELIVSSGAGQTEQALSFFCVLVDAVALVQQLLHCVHVSVGAGLRQATAKNNQTATITATVQAKLS